MEVPPDECEASTALIVEVLRFTDCEAREA
jgi:hypothetical protein